MARRRRRNPRLGKLALYGGLAAGAYYLYEKHKTATPATPTPIANPNQGVIIGPNGLTRQLQYSGPTLNQGGIFGQ